MNQPFYQPFIIIGHPRSGTTLLRLLISSHPRLHIPAETGFLPFLATDPEAHLDRREVSDLLHRIGRLNRDWDGVVLDEESFYSSLLRPALPTVLDALYRLKLPPESVRWGDKTPLYVQYIPQIRAIFPGAQFVHIIRDGRDAALSARAKWGRSKYYQDLSYVLRNWVRNVQSGRAASERLGPDLYHEIRYEDLITDPNRTLQSLYAFLREPYDPAAQDYGQLAGQARNGGRLELQQILRSDSIGRWRREMTSFEHQLADSIAGSLLAELGYTAHKDLAPPSVSDRLRMAWLAAKFQVLDGLRTQLYRWRLLTLNRDRRRWR